MMLLPLFVISSRYNWSIGWYTYLTYGKECNTNTGVKCQRPRVGGVGRDDRQVRRHVHTRKTVHAPAVVSLHKRVLLCSRADKLRKRCYKTLFMQTQPQERHGGVEGRGWWTLASVAGATAHASKNRCNRSPRFECGTFLRTAARSGLEMAHSAIIQL